MSATGGVPQGGRQSSAGGTSLTRAVWLAVAADGLLTLMDAIIKTLTPRYPTFQIAFLRFAFGSLCSVILVAALRPGWPGREAVIFNSTRSLLAVVTATLFFYALSVLPLGEAIALSFLSPLFTVLFGAIILQERLDARIGLALLSGLAGMALIVGHRIGTAHYAPEAWLGAGAVVGSAISYGLVVVILRARATRDPTATIVLFQNVIPALVLLVPAVWVWRQPNHADLATFALLGVLGVSGHYCLARAFARAEAARLAPIHYVTLVWGVAFAYVFFSELPTVAMLTGAALIVAGTVFTHRRR